jgi:nitrite reductase/ring-hydroxylating ferredoxin subunit
MSISEKIRFCTIAELKEKTIITKWVENWRDEVSAIFTENNIVVFSTICPHFGGEMELVKSPIQLRCKWHHWSFDLKTGKCLSSKMPACLRKYSYQETDEYIEVSLA